MNIIEMLKATNSKVEYVEFRDEEEDENSSYTNHMQRHLFATGIQITHFRSNSKIFYNYIRDTELEGRLFIYYTDNVLHIIFEKETDEALFLLTIDKTKLLYYMET